MLNFFLLFLVSAALAQSACPPLELVYARATTEAPQNGGSGQQWEAAANRNGFKGYGAAGHSLWTNITSLIPEAGGYPVHYPASFSGCTSEDPGIKDMQHHLTSRAAECPNIRFVLGGHSQGGFVTVRTIARLPQEVKDKIVAVTMFGSPPCLQKLGLQGRCKSYCYAKDEVCDSTSYKSVGKCVDELLPEITGGKGKGGLSTAHRFVDLDQRQGRSVNVGGSELLGQSYAPPTVVECLKGSLLGANEERGVAVKGQSHLQYNTDGKYIREAACFVYRQWIASQKGAQ